MEIRRFYWDSCAFIHYIQETAEYIGGLDYIVGSARSGTSIIVTSSVTLAEVCKIPDQGLLPIEQSKKILGFFENPYIELWQADRNICEDAHHVIRHSGILPMDAIHIATAINSKIDMIITTDSKKHRRNGLLAHDGRFGSPPIPIKKPEISAVLPLWPKETPPILEGKASEEENRPEA